MQDLENEIKSIIAEVTEQDIEGITPDAKFVEDLGMDSMMALEIMAAMEKKYRITIPEEKLPLMRTLSETVGIVKEYMGKKG